MLKGLKFFCFICFSLRNKPLKKDTLWKPTCMRKAERKNIGKTIHKVSECSLFHLFYFRKCFKMQKIHEQKYFYCKSFPVSLNDWFACWFFFQDFATVKWKVSWRLWTSAIDTTAWRYLDKASAASGWNIFLPGSIRKDYF